MTDILQNALVRKYFGEDRPGAVIECDDPRKFNYEQWLAYNVVRAMQEPIRKGERYLVTYDLGRTWAETRVTGCEADEPLHPFELRLPSRFQKPEHKHEWVCVYCDPKPAPEPRKCGCGMTWGTVHRFDGPCVVLSKSGERGEGE